MSLRSVSPHRHRAWLGALCLILGYGANAQELAFNTGSDGSFGPLNVAENTTLDLPADGIIHATTVTVASGATLAFNRNALNTPVYLLAQGDVIIAGTIDVTGQRGTNTAGGLAGPGGFDGGAPGAFDEPSSDGHGPGAGKGGSRATAGGAGYAFRQSISTSDADGPIYGSKLLIPIVGGSGGGGAQHAPEGVGGGGGGGALLLASNTRIEITGSGILAASGGQSGSLVDAVSNRNGGSGGAIRLVAPVIAGAGKLYASGRSNHHTGFQGGGSTMSEGGGAGRIRIDSIDRSAMSFDFFPSSGTTVSIGGNMLVFLDPQPRIDILSVAGTDIPVGTTNGITIQLPFNADPNRQITVQARDFGVEIPITIALQPSSGERVLIEDVIDNSTANPATKTIDITLPVNVETTIHVWTRPN